MIDDRQVCCDGVLDKSMTWEGGEAAITLYSGTRNNSCDTTNAADTRGAVQDFILPFRGIYPWRDQGNFVFRGYIERRAWRRWIERANDTIPLFRSSEGSTCNPMIHPSPTLTHFSFNV